MRGRSRWLPAVLLAAVVALLLGRWVAVQAVDALWADALGVGDPHRSIAMLRATLQAIAFSAAAVWCVGNLFIVYRSIGAVQLPRRLGNLEIVETVPRPYLLAGAFGVGVILALAMSHGAGGWWSHRALLDASVVLGERDPVLGRDASYYLFTLPWHRTLQHYALLLTGVVLAVVLFLYIAVGAVRLAGPRITVMDLARTHVGMLLLAFAFTLFWGYRLEPAELVAGYERVPYDAILTGVRVPAARVLSGAALVVAGASAIWIWLGHVAVVGVAWVALGLASFTAHVVAPAFSAAARAPEDRADSLLAAREVAFVREAFGLAQDSTAAPLAIPDPDFTVRRAAQLERLPVWDPFAVTTILNHLARPRLFDRFFDATLAVFENADGESTPVFLAVREVDREAARDAERRMTWERRHGRPYAYASGVVAVHAARATDEGLPEFVPDLARPDSTVRDPVDVRGPDVDVWFAPATSEFAVATVDDGPAAGVRAGGLLRRVLLAWILQSPHLVTSPQVSASSVVLFDRAVGVRLGRYAPFARFGGAYPVVADSALYWVAPGYVAAEAFPLSAAVRWRGRVVRYLRSGLVGVVNARTGATSVHLLPDADPLSRAWAGLADGIVRPFDALPAQVQARLRYPDELFRVQVDLLRRSDWRPGEAGGAARTPEPYWWVGPSVGDSIARLRVRSVIEVQAEARVASIVEGTVRDGTPRLDVTAYPQPLTLPGPSDLVQEFARGVTESAAIPGQLKLAAFADGALGVQAFYAGPGAGGGPPRLAEVAVGWRGAVGRALTLPAALRRVQVSRPPPPPVSDRWEDAQEWFRRLDSARAAGDWIAFGEAYAALKRILGPPDDTAR